MRENPRAEELFRHFKGNMYQIVCLATDSEDGKDMVVYRALYGDYKVYVRPLEMFMSEVDHAKYPDVTQKYRFERPDEHEVYEEPVSDAEPEANTTNVSDTAPDLESSIHPLVLDFLDASTYEKRLEILSRIHPIVTDDMINTMAMACDLEIDDGDIEKRYAELKNCLLTYEKFECNRLR